MELQPTFLHNREIIKANVREGIERDSEQKSGNAEAFQSINQSNQRHKALKINSKFFFFGSLFLFSSPKKEKVNKVQTISKVLSDKLKRNVRGNRATRKAAFTLAEVFSPFYLSPRRVAFTLAEVLITLGIIGVVAAMTLPTIIQKYQNKVVETKLAKFYTTINQAIKLAEVQYGDKKYWYQSSNSYETDPDTGEVIQGSSEVEKWWKKYIAPNMPTVDIKYDKENLPIFYFKDGSALKAQHTNAMTDWVFYTINPEKCEALSDAGGRCRFLFIYMPAGDGGYIQGSVLQYTRFKYHLDRGMEPYKWCWDGKRETLLSGNISCADGSESGYLGCTSEGSKKAAYCTALIQLNGWKIPKDYPFKVLGY